MGFFKLINVSSEWTVYSPEGTKSSSIPTQHECLHLCNVSIWVSAFESPNLDSSNVLFSVKTCSILSFDSASRESKKDGGKRIGSVFVGVWRRRAPSPRTVLPVSLPVMWALMSSGKGSSFRWRRAAKSGCFVFGQNLPVKPRKGSESHKVTIFKAIPGWMSCLNRFVLWWAAGIADVTPKRKSISSKTTYRPRHAMTLTFDLSRSSLTTMLKSGKPSIGSPKSAIIMMDIPPVKETQRVSRQTPPTPSIHPRQPLSAAACPYLAFRGFPECFRYTITKGKGNQESALTGRHNTLWWLMITDSTCQVFV